jgi:L-amino acid N-acyltransferase YncA
MTPYDIAPLAEADRDGVLRVFNHFVERSFAAYPEEKAGLEFFDRVVAMTEGWPAVAVHTPDGAVIGFAFLHAHRPSSTFRRTAEITYFLLPEHTGKGLGRRILARFIDAARERGVDNLLANVSSLNEQSLRFHERAGFERVGCFPAVGFKFGRDFDIVWFQKRI